MLRSMLFRPGDSLKKMKKGAAGPADALILDLEDSVAEMNRPAARTPCAGFSCGTGVSIEFSSTGCSAINTSRRSAQRTSDAQGV